jgi:hypothetical protein
MHKERGVPLYLQYIILVSSLLSHKSQPPLTTPLMADAMLASLEGLITHATCVCPRHPGPLWLGASCMCNNEGHAEFLVKLLWLA